VSALAFAASAILATQTPTQLLADDLPPPSATIDRPPQQLAAASVPNYHDGSFVGPVTDAYYGDMQVKVTVSGGRIVAVDALKYPSDRSTSRRINDRALPILQSEVIRAQSVRVNAVSGATLTSKAYIQSLGRALAQAAS
jgi:uncharacterized protein with FMN-binding domain